MILNLFWSPQSDLQFRYELPDKDSYLGILIKSITYAQNVWQIKFPINIKLQYLYLFTNLKMFTQISVSFLFQIYLFSTFICLTFPITDQLATPTYLKNNYFRAGNENAINTLTEADATLQYTFTFSSSFQGIPKLAYAVKNYQGADYFGQERFQVRRIDLTASTFKVNVQTQGSTYIHTLNVAYIAIDPTFPHHLNCFNNVPLNYNNGPLTNITNKSSTTVLKYTNLVNYTVQSTGMAYTKFKTPLENNKILLYLTGLHIFGSNSQTADPIDLRVSATVLSEENYEFKATLSINVNITLIHFCQIMLDEGDVKFSNKYFIVIEYYDVPQKGGFIEFPEELKDNFMMGLTDFSTQVALAALYYNWEFTTLANGTFGAQIKESTPKPDLDIFQSALKRQGTVVFYMMTWQCPPGFDYFDVTSRLCQQDCGNQTFQEIINEKCDYVVCDYCCPKGYYTDESTGACETCIGACQICYGPTLNQCTKCKVDTAPAIEVSYYKVMNLDQCTTDCPPGYYEENTGLICAPCHESCLTCDTSATDCTSCGSSADVVYFLHIDAFCYETCPERFYGEIVNGSTNLCSDCDVKCQICSGPSHDECMSCRTEKNITYFLEYGTNSCVVDCPDGQYSDAALHLCRQCNQNCRTCSHTTFCHQCKIDRVPEVFLENNACVQTCKIGYYGQMSNHTCTICADGCSSCDGPSLTDCFTCKTADDNITQYYKVVDKNQCVAINCPKGQFRSTLILNQCQLCAIQCETCEEEADKCTNNSSKCQDGFYQDTNTNVCQTCHTYCARCFGPLESQCYECKKNYYIIEDETKRCSADCPKGQYKDPLALKCLKCNSNCQTCENSSENCTDEMISPLIISMTVLIGIILITVVVCFIYKFKKKRRVNNRDNNEISIQNTSMIFFHQ